MYWNENDISYFLQHLVLCVFFFFFLFSFSSLGFRAEHKDIKFNDSQFLCFNFNAKPKWIMQIVIVAFLIHLFLYFLTLLFRFHSFAVDSFAPRNYFPCNRHFDQISFFDFGFKWHLNTFDKKANTKAFNSLSFIFDCNCCLSKINSQIDFAYQNFHNQFSNQKFKWSTNEKWLVSCSNQINQIVYFSIFNLVFFRHFSSFEFVQDVGNRQRKGNDDEKTVFLFSFFTVCCHSTAMLNVS